MSRELTIDFVGVTLGPWKRHGLVKSNVNVQNCWKKNREQHDSCTRLKRLENMTEMLIKFYTVLERGYNWYFLVTERIYNEGDKLKQKKILFQ